MKGSPKGGLEENTFIKAYDDMEKSGKTPVRGPEAFPLIEIVHGPKQGAWFTVAYQKELTLGRAATNSIILEDNSVSRSHAVLQSNGTEYTVRDIGSRNGTFVNAKKIQGEVALKHLDNFKIGIYTLRFLEEATEEIFELEAKEEHTPRFEDEMPKTEIAEAMVGQAPAEEELPPEGEEMALPPTQEVKRPDEKTINEDLAHIISHEPAAGGKKGMPRALRNLLILLLIFGVLGGGGYAAYHFGALDKLKAYLGSPKTKVAQKGDKKEAIPPLKVIVPPKGTDALPAGQGVPVLLEVNSQPTGAKIFYKGKELGVTPFKVSVQAPAGQPQELMAEFFLDGIGEKYTEKSTFQAKQQDELITVALQPKVGKLKVTALPKDGNLYLEGKFEGQNESKPLKVGNIAFDTPVFLPYGSYVVEVRLAQSLPGSTTSTVNAVKFRREFQLGPGKPEFTLHAPDEAIQSFPAKINSTPTGAELLVDGKKLGDTPFDGNLPTGRHKLTLKKEGFNAFEQEIAIEMNIPFEASYSLITTAAGEFINKGRTHLKRGQVNEAIENLAEALKRNPSGTEISYVHTLLGDAFLQSKTYDQSLAYFQKAAESPEYATQAQLGMAEAHAGLGQNDQALLKVIKVLVSSKDPKIQSQADSIYHKMYPLKSVLYIATQPEGANVSISGNPIAQVTPVILSEIGTGVYRVKIEKPGYKPYETRVTMPLSAVKPLVVTLQPETN